MIKGHLNTDGLDPVTAQAVQLLAAADLVAAEQYQSGSGPHGPLPRRWRDPGHITLVLAMICLVILSLGYLRIVNQNATAERSRTQIAKLTVENHHLNQQVFSCVMPTGKCYQDGQSRQGKAVAAIVHETTVNICRITNPNADKSVIARCVAVAENVRP